MGHWTTTQRIIAFPPNMEISADTEFRFGVLSWAKSHCNWRFIMPELRVGEQDPGFTAREVDAAIVPGNNIKAIKLFRRRKIPLLLGDPFPIDFKSISLYKGLSFTKVDNAAIAQMAVDLFITHGYTSLAYVDEPNEHSWSAERRCAFVRIAKAAKARVDVYANFTDKERKSWLSERPRMIRWLQSLPKPTAILAAMDGRARLVLDACQVAGIPVPEDIAVLGVDNNRLICESTSPALSSIRINGFKYGELAAETLAKLIDQPDLAPIETHIPPESVLLRDSIAYGAMQDPTVAKALRFIHENTNRPISVLDVAAASACSRRHLEILFTKKIGQSIKHCILNARLALVKDLLLSTTLSISEIAERCGFPYESNLSTTFKRETGLTMQEWRQ